MQLRLTKLATLVSMAAIATPVLATDLRFDGFASFIAGKSINKEHGDNRDEFHGYDDKLSYQDNSLFALQARANLENGLTATAQITAKGKDEYQSKFIWAYLAYELNNEWSVRFGRSRIPFFMYSDYLDVGYAYHWISPPSSVYGLAGFDSTDGIAIDNQTSLGDWVSRLTIMNGRTHQDLAIGGSSANSEIGQLSLASWSMNYDWFTGRIVYANARLTMPFQDLEDGAKTLTDLGVSEKTASKATIDGDPAKFAGIGFSIDREKYLIVGEYTSIHFEDNNLGNPTNQWYLSAGYRLGEVMPYVTYEDMKTKIPHKYAEAILNELPDGIRAAAEPEVNTLFNAFASDYSNYGIGVRYDFHPSAAFKVEYVTQDDRLTHQKPAALAAGVQLTF